MLQSGTCYLICCSTGCTCCAGENHTRGPFSSMVAAEEARNKFMAMPLLASQFSRTGRYGIEAATYEEISGNRMIINGTTVVADFVDDNPTSNDAIYC